MRKAIFACVCCCIYFVLPAQNKITYTRQEAMIPMRDGIKLYAVIFIPDGIAQPLPILMERTPYGSEHSQSPEKSAYLGDMANEGYIFVIQDIRGRYKSEGKFMMNRPILDKPNEVDESTDTWDTVDWLIHNIKNNNGKVG